ncbi:MAG: fatty acid cis/trans isomerase, partial [Pseudomonadota bacterium]|nr:fatty acid cis/trans isomerase [Pseudomonadota bacterium]
MMFLQRYLPGLATFFVCFLLSPARAADPTLSYQSDIQPIFDSKCLACHGCYDAPCQLKLEAPEGLDRGASKDKVYNGARTESVPPTRLFLDAGTTSQWREKDFFSVIDSTSGMQSSLLYRMLALGKEHRFA